MKAEDTVMTPEIRDSGKYWNDRYHGVRDVEAICKAQAKISFKAGEQLSLERQGQAYLEGKQEGIKEVVEWVEEHSTIMRPPYDYYRRLGTPLWQAQLKDWGL